MHREMGQEPWYWALAQVCDTLAQPLEICESGLGNELDCSNFGEDLL